MHSQPQISGPKDCRNPVLKLLLSALRPKHLQRNLMLAGAGILATQTGLKLWQLRQRPAHKAALKGQTVIVTGASSGIGKALAQELAQNGCNLVLAARRADLLQTLAHELETRHGVKVLTVPTDVTDDGQTRSLIDKALARFGQIDILINNAGTATFSYFHKDDLAKMRQVMEVNYWGTVNCTRAVLPDMMAHHSGMIVNISSVAGKIGQPGMGNYSGTKHAVNGLTESLRVEVSKYGIHVLLICPTSTKTEIVSRSSNHQAVNFNPENYIGMSAEKVARDTVNAIADRRRELIFGLGEKLGLGIHTVAPEVVDAVFQKAIPFLFKD